MHDLTVRLDLVLGAKVRSLADSTAVVVYGVVLGVGGSRLFRCCNGRSASVVAVGCRTTAGTGRVESVAVQQSRW